MPFRIALCLLAAASILPAESGTRIDWNEFAKLATPRHLIRVKLPDGVRVQAIARSFSATGATVYVTKTSAKNLHPKGEMMIPREQLRVVEVRSPRVRARWIATLSGVGLTAGLFLAATKAEEAPFYGLLIAGGASVGGIPALYFLGRAVDRRLDTYLIAP